MGSRDVDPVNADDPLPVERVQGGFHVVIDGFFNPMILLPKWLGEQGLLRLKEVESANKTLTANPAFVAFNTSGLSFVCSPQTLEVFSNNEGHVLVIRDLIQSVFTLLSHTPLKTLTISRSGHFGVASPPGEEVVTPSWDPLLPRSVFAPVLRSPGLSDLAAKGPGILPLPGSETVVSVQPSEISEASLFVECRYSGSLEDGDGRSGAVVLTDLLKDCLEQAERHSQTVFAHFCDLLFRPTSAGRS